eukprot:comp13667_c0_seq4/m.19139 comp13667_c0_seq4/g.19139  ORF comp13667_c0_seq4/g.19139 comp13667_c0_seq4/m.19139 type:complete len:106 (+) comp13667_c0_seq4:125-442(+)
MIALKPEKFALTYTLGNILSLGSTAFLVGPVKQLKNMFDPSRAVASVVYVVSLVLTLVAALKMHSAPLSFIMIIIQLCALSWYVLSYIPFGRQIVSSCCSSVVGV